MKPRTTAIIGAFVIAVAVFGYRLAGLLDLDNGLALGRYRRGQVR